MESNNGVFGCKQNGSFLTVYHLIITKATVNNSTDILMIIFFVTLCDHKLFALNTKCSQTHMRSDKSCHVGILMNLKLIIYMVELRVREYHTCMKRYSLLAVYKNWCFAIYLQNNKTNPFGVWCILNGYLIHN